MRGRGEALDARAGRDGRARIGALTGKRGLSPAYFAFVMATGIVAIDARDVGMPTTATALFGLNVVAFALVACVALLHAVRAPRAAWHDVTNHHSGPPHLASVAAAAVLGSDFLLLADRRGAAALLGWAAVAAWLVLTYAVFAGITVSGDVCGLHRRTVGRAASAVPRHRRHRRHLRRAGRVGPRVHRARAIVAAAHAVTHRASNLARAVTSSPDPS